ncbi:MAG: M14 family zinc carboxypeptidase, partial [Bryobacteraceae bacterium]
MRFLATILLALAPLLAQQAQDAGYTAKIKEYTTEPFFLTEIVDHLPASATVPTPEKVLGYVIGTPNRLTYTKDVFRYMRELEKASPRVRTFAGGRSEEGREFMLVAISDEANMRRLDQIKQLTARLADPRKLTPAEAATVIDQALPIYWASGAIHSPETGSPEMLMEMAYRLAVEETPLIQNIRRNSVVLITPVLEVDGRDKQVDLYLWRKANPNRAAPNLLYWGKYVAHDNNRDGMALSLELSRFATRSFLDWRPQVLHDLHESVPFLYTSTGTGPYNAWLDPIVISEWQKLAYHEIEEMTKRGVPGVWTHGFYDGWAANYMFTVANGHNSIGRFYETFGGRGADTIERTVPANQTTRTWFRPNPPLPRVRWSIRNNINLQQSALLLAMNHVAANKKVFLENFYLKSRRSVEKASKEGPAAWVIPGDDPRPLESADLVNLLGMHAVEVHRLNAAVEKPQKFAAGSYVIRMDQPYSRMADMLLDRQYYSVNDPRPYDDTGWSHGPLRNVQTVRVTDKAILEAPMSALALPVKLEGKLEGPQKAAAYAVNHTAENAVATFRFRLKGLRVHAAEDSFQAGGRTFAAGSLLMRQDGNPADLRARLEKAAADLGLAVQALAEAPGVAAHELSEPRVALVHT